MDTRHKERVSEKILIEWVCDGTRGWRVFLQVLLSSRGPGGGVGGIIEWVLSPSRGIMLDLKVRVKFPAKGVETIYPRGGGVGSNLFGD
jgi:hypothetical protein